MVSIPSPPCFIYSFTNWSAPAAFLFLSLATHFFTYFLVKSLWNPSEPLSSLSDASAFDSAQALISFSNCASKVLLVLGIDVMLYY